MKRWLKRIAMALALLVALAAAALFAGRNPVAFPQQRRAFLGPGVEQFWRVGRNPVAIRPAMLRPL